MTYPHVWELVKKVFYPILGYSQAVQTIDTVAAMDALETFNYLADRLQLKNTVQGLSHIPQTGCAIIAANHPAGIADGVALFAAVKDIRQDITFFANRDAIRAAPNLLDMVIPVEWVEEKRTHTRNKETLAHMVRAFRSRRLIVMFPSGRLAKPSWRGLLERPRTTTVANLARRYDAPVLPVNVKARNSWLYYLLYLVNTELKDMTLFRELLNKQGQPYQIRVGPPMVVEGDVREATDAIREVVLRELA